MKKQLKLEADRKSAKEGEFIDIRWDCQVCPDSLILTFDSGHKTDKITVSDSGSTRIAIPNCKGKFRIRLIAGISGKKVTEEVAVRVLNVRTKRQNARSRAGRFKLWGEKLHASWCVFRAQCKYWWLSQKKWQKALWIALLILWLGLLVFSFVKTPAPMASDSQTAYLMNLI